jgi:paraquat-inducible protein B
VIEVEPERIETTDSDAAAVRHRIARLVEKGLRAHLGRGNLLTGGLQVEFDMRPDVEPATLLVGGAYPELPTIPAPFDEMTASIGGVIAKIDRLPLDQIGRDLQASLFELRRLAASINSDVMPAFAATMKRLDGTVGSLEGMLRPDAPLPLELRRSLEDVGEAARSVRVLAEYLEQHPEALIRGKK